MSKSKAAPAAVAAPAIVLNKAFADALSGPIHRTWNVIAGDVGQLGGRSSFSGNLEMCLDADRLSSYGGGHGVDSEGHKANQLVNEACKQHGYNKVSKYLLRHIKLAF